MDCFCDEIILVSLFYSTNRFSPAKALSSGDQVGRCTIYLKVQFIENRFQTCLGCWHKFSLICFCKTVAGHIIIILVCLLKVHQVKL